MPLTLFDSHAHYDDSAFDCDREALLDLLPSKGVCGIVNAASDLSSTRRGIALAERYPYAIVPWGLIPVAAICNVSPLELARKNLIPVCIGFACTFALACFML